MTLNGVRSNSSKTLVLAGALALAPVCKAWS